MFTREALSLDDCQAAIAGMIAEWKKNTGNPPDYHGGSRP